MKQCLGHGQWVVRWVPDLYFGYGYPLFNFYPPLFYILGAMIANIGAGITMAYDLSLFIILFLSGCAMYLFARELWGKQGGFVSATAYLFAPYHMVDLYMKAAGAETMSFIFLPLILWSFYKLQQTSLKRYIVYSALSCAGLLLTHNCTSIIFFPLVPFYILLLFWPYSSWQRWISLMHSFLVLALGVGLAAFFWLPAFVEKKFVHVELMGQGNLNFKENFVYFKDLISPGWGNNMPYFGSPHMVSRIGIVHGLLVLIVLLGFKKIVEHNPRLNRQIFFFLAALTGSIFLTINYSMVIWEHIRVLQYLQFPFRFLTVVVLAGSVIAGGVVLWVQQEHRFKVMFVAVVLIFLTNFSYCHPRDTFPCDLRLVKTDPGKFLSVLVPQDGGDYIPIWVKNGVKGLPSSMPLQKLQSFSKEGQVIDSTKRSPLRYRFMVQAQKVSIFCFNSFYFPGWTVKVDGHYVEVLTDNPWGFIIFPCPQGVHNVDIYFGTTPLRQMAKRITIGSLILLGLVFIFPFRKFNTG
ncbi:MAG: hypothetical protein HQL12_08275 [Candidatus Omnitrophica bacterium]|nr:hypothetical protein [Candidatus Omnitrophota bacterium]